jgi:AraC family transcriptional regulator
MGSQVQRIRQASLAGFTLTESIHPAGSEIPWHWHETPTICFVLEGAFVEAMRGSSLLCTPATLKFVPAGERHCDRFSHGQARGLMVEPRPDGETGRLFPLALDRPRHYQGGALVDLALRIHQELIRMDPTSPLVIEGLLLELIAGAAREADGSSRGNAPGWLARALECIDDGLAGPLGVTRIALAVGVHPVTLARAFRRRYQCTMGDYVRRRRIERAKQQLRNSRVRLAEIAAANGFADQSHISRLFRQYTGTTPSRFRREVS